MKHKFYFLTLIYLTAAFQLSFAQNPVVSNVPGFYDTVRNNMDSSSKLLVRSIRISGNKKTKSYIILRELLFREGDSIIAGDIYNKVEQSRQLVYNTALFTEVNISPVFDPPYSGIAIQITVKEKWYLYPTPQFQLVDRNLNEWLKVHNGSLDRVIYGLKFLHYNFSGRRDHLRIFLLNGYSRNISFGYTAPYSNAALTEGFGFAAGYAQNREIAFKTTYNNKQLQFNDGSFSRNIFTASGLYQIRKGYFTRHSFNIGFTHMKLKGSIIKQYNPDYFRLPDSIVGFSDLGYTYQYVNVDNINYPLTGKTFTASLMKRGFKLKGGLNMLSTDIASAKFISHGKNWYSSFGLTTKLKLPFEQSYYNLRALGFNDYYLRGLEYYVIDGVASGVAKYTLKKKLFSFDLPVPFNIRILPKIPFTFYAKAFTDAGYSYIGKTYDTRLNNRFLYSGGFGIDVVTLYDMSLRIEYSFNQLGENGLFLHTRGGF